MLLSFQGQSFFPYVKPRPTNFIVNHLLRIVQSMVVTLLAAWKEGKPEGVASFRAPSLSLLYVHFRLPDSEQGAHV